MISPKLKDTKGVAPGGIFMDEVQEKEKKIFHSTLAPNKQVTLKKSIRDDLGIEPNDIVFLQVIKVSSPDGTTKYEWKPDSVGEQ